METLLDTYVLSGGPLMVPLIFCSLWLVASVIRLSLRLRRGRVMPDDLLEQAHAITDRRERDAFARALGQESSPLALAVSRTLEGIELQSGRPVDESEVQPILNEAVAEVTDDLYHGIRPLETLYTVGPLLGLLGTIMGMMNAFGRFADVEQKSVTVLSQGIKIALITTMWGLIVAIPSYVASQYFQGKIRRYERELLPRRGLEILEALFGGGAGRAPASEAKPAPARPQPHPLTPSARVPSELP